MLETSPLSPETTAAGPDAAARGELRREAERATRALLDRAARHCGIPSPEVLIRFDLRGTAAGQVRFPARGRPVIRYNALLLVENGRRFLERTVPHEIAHVVARAAYGSTIRPHGPEWRELMRFLGVDPRRCHDYDTGRAQARHMSRVPYHCGCRDHALTLIRHNRIQAGRSYYCRACGTPLRPGARSAPR